MNIIGGLDRYTDGDLIIGGKSTKDYKDKDWDVYRNHRIGFVFQSYNLIPHQTVLGNVELALTIAGVSKTERKKRAKEALKKVGLEKEIKKRPNQLSGGQMQRVAIARALVNNPEILLADEPTGALDTETSVQIMELIREIAGERLVIMVTHNPELAEQYSSRIVRLSDGLVVSDTNPYDSAAERKGLEEKMQRMGRTKEQLAAWLAAKRSQDKGAEKASMSHATALGLSGRNLVAKKGRTAITSIAGSIGIIGVSLVLALRGGFTTYIANTEKDMLSAYPLTITETTLDYASIMQSMQGGNAQVDLSKLHDSIYVNSFLTKLANNMMSTNVITQEYLDYLDEMDPDHYYAKQLSYGGDIGNNLFQTLNFKVSTPEEGDIEPSYEYAMSLNTLISMYKGQLDNSEDSGEYQSFSMMFGSVTSVTYEMPNNQDYILSQYDVVAGEYPDASSKNEMVLVLNNDGGMTDLVMAQLGLLSMDEVLELFKKDLAGGGDELTYIPHERLLEHKYIYYPNDAIYKETVMPSLGGQKVWQKTGAYNPKANMSVDESMGTEIKIGCILRAKEETKYGSLASGLAYMPGFTEQYLTDSRASGVAADGEGKQIYSLDFASMIDAMSSGDYSKMRYMVEDVSLRNLGAELMPNAISIYVKDFDHKDAVTAHLDRWNNEIKADSESEQIQYTDTVAVLMTLVRGMLDAVTYVLVAFTAISLVVSSVMIGVITYVSVVERTKEIGVLRSLGARKKDIRRLFNAETFLIGLCAGAFGVGITYALSVPINLILNALTGINGLAALPLGQGITMVVVSVVLTLISGLIPANAAAKKDPVIALRTE